MERVVEGFTVVVVWVPIIVIVRVHAVGEAVVVEVGELRVDVSVTVVVDAIADLVGLRVGVRVEGTTVGAVDHSVVVIVWVTDVSNAVTVEVRLACVGVKGAVVLDIWDPIGVRVIITGITGPIVVRVELKRVWDVWADIDCVIDPVPVIVVVGAVCDSVAVHVREALIDRVVAVVVDPVTHLQREGGFARVFGGAITDVGGPIVVIIDVDTVDQAIVIGVRLARVRDAIAIVVDSVTDVFEAVPDVSVVGGAVHTVWVAVAI
jgi:hypothetical protein